ncbi:MAG: hypothetical protein ACE5K1_06130 [Acidiferrobacterales bacterium]
MKAKLLTLMTLLWLACPAWAQDTPEDVLQAAKAGNPEAQLEMGILYEFGFFLEDNQVPALAWYMLAAEQGNQKATQRRDTLMSRMSQAQIDQARTHSAQLAHSATPTQ